MDKSGKIIFVGKLGKESELKYTQTLKAICILSVAVKSDDNQNTEWNKVVVWGKQAELANLYLKKGSDVFLQARKESKEFRSKNGELKKYEEANAHLIGFSNM